MSDPLDAQQNGTGGGVGRGGRGGRAVLGAGRGGRGGRGAGVHATPPDAIFVKGMRGVTIVKPDAATKTGLILGSTLC